MVVRNVEALVPVSSLQVGDVVKTSVKAKPHDVVEKKLVEGGDWRIRVGADVRTYRPSDVVIKVTKVNA